MSYTQFLNRDIGQHTLSEILASKCDKMMRKGNQLTDEQLDKYIDTTSGIFSNIEDKDLFLEVYRLGLSKRLLNDKYAIEFEKQFIGRIKMSCGPQFTSKLEGMITDLKTSKSVDTQYHEE